MKNELESRVKELEFKVSVLTKKLKELYERVPQPRNRTDSDDLFDEIERMCFEVNEEFKNQNTATEAYNSFVAGSTDLCKAGESAL